MADRYGAIVQGRQLYDPAADNQIRFAAYVADRVPDRNLPFLQEQTDDDRLLTSGTCTGDAP